MRGPRHGLVAFGRHCCHLRHHAFLRRRWAGRVGDLRVSSGSDRRRLVDGSSVPGASVGPAVVRRTCRRTTVGGRWSGLGHPGVDSVDHGFDDEVEYFVRIRGGCRAGVGSAAGRGPSGRWPRTSEDHLLVDEPDDGHRAGGCCLNAADVSRSCAAIGYPVAHRASGRKGSRPCTWLRSWSDPGWAAIIGSSTRRWSSESSSPDRKDLAWRPNLRLLYEAAPDPNEIFASSSNP